MGLVQIRHAPGAVADRRQFLQHRVHRQRVVSGARNVDQRAGIGTVFHVAVEHGQHHCRALLRKIVGELSSDAGMGCRLVDHDGAGDGRHRLLVDHVVVIARDHVADLVAEYGRDLVVGLQQLVQASGHEHIATRRGERVDLVGVEHRERPRQVVARGLHRYPAADRVDPLLRLRIVPQRQRAKHAARNLRTHRGFLIDFFLFALGNRIHRRAR